MDEKRNIINFLYEQPLNDYLKNLVYKGGKPAVIKPDDVETVRQNIDMIVRNNLFQYLKFRVRCYIDAIKYPCFVKVDKNRPDLPDWTQTTFQRGEDIYEFDSTNVPQDFQDELVKICDYLYPVAFEYVEQICQNGDIQLLRKYDYLKNSDEYKDLGVVLQMVNKENFNKAISKMKNKMQESSNLYSVAEQEIEK